MAASLKELRLRLSSFYSEGDNCKHQPPETTHQQHCGANVKPPTALLQSISTARRAFRERNRSRPDKRRIESNTDGVVPYGTLRLRLLFPLPRDQDVVRLHEGAYKAWLIRELLAFVLFASPCAHFSRFLPSSIDLYRRWNYGSLGSWLPFVTNRSHSRLNANNAPNAGAAAVVCSCGAGLIFCPPDRMHTIMQSRPHIAQHGGCCCYYFQKSPNGTPHRWEIV